VTLKAIEMRSVWSFEALDTVLQPGREDEQLPGGRVKGSPIPEPTQGKSMPGVYTWQRQDARIRNAISPPFIFLRDLDVINAERKHPG